MKFFVMFTMLFVLISAVAMADDCTYTRVRNKLCVNGPLVSCSNNSAKSSCLGGYEEENYIGDFDCWAPNPLGNRRNCRPKLDPNDKSVQIPCLDKYTCRWVVIEGKAPEMGECKRSFGGPNTTIKAGMYEEIFCPNEDNPTGPLP